MTEERIVIVNEKDEIIGNSPRNSYKKMGMGRGIGLFIYNSRGDILIAQRSKLKSQPEKWGFAVTGGYSVDDKSYKDAIFRESEEELGLNLNEFNVVESVKIKSTFYFTQWFIAQINVDVSKFVMKEDEVMNVKWISKSNFEKDLKINPESFVRSLNVHYKEIKKFEKEIFN